jgi:basic membrane lipoprotein Med (substrate-binding protein (PBP1-ABC) superfamily)
MRARKASPVASLALLALAACGGSGGGGGDASASKPESAAAPAGAVAGSAPADAAKKPFRVALLSPGPVSDAGWNAAAYDGLKKIEHDLGATIAQVETKTPPEFESGFREFALQGFDLVFGHGFEFQDAAAKVGAEFPKTVFITTSGSTVKANVAPMVFRLEQATYLLGVTAAMMSKTGKAGVVGGMEIPSVGSTFLAFEAGVHAKRPDMPVLKTYVGSWDDVSAAKEATLAQVRQGADFVLHNADAAGLGVFRAVEEASTAAHPVYAFGSNKDQAPVAPKAVLASAVLDIPTAFEVVARSVKEGTFTARVMELGMKEGIVSLQWNPALEGGVPADVKAEVEARRAQILDGSLKVPTGF